jgi:hypothetical protein
LLQPKHTNYATSMLICQTRRKGTK